MPATAKQLPEFLHKIVAKVLWFVTLYAFILVEPLVTVVGFERSRNREDI